MIDNHKRKRRIKIQGRKLFYENKLNSPQDIKEFILEGSAHITFPEGRMRMENKIDPKEGQKSNFVLWCNQDFPENIEVEWEFWPIEEPGLCMFFFAAKGQRGEDIFSPHLSSRTGEYDQYHHGDINAFHLAYFRRRYEEERAFHLCNLRKSYGGHLLQQGADPIPSIEDGKPPYHIFLRKYRGEILFKINDLSIIQWQDDGKTYGPLLEDGKIGFRQMAPLVAEYANLKVYEL